MCLQVVIDDGGESLVSFDIPFSYHSSTWTVHGHISLGLNVPTRCLSSGKEEWRANGKKIVRASPSAVVPRTVKGCSSLLTLSKIARRVGSSPERFSAKLEISTSMGQSRPEVASVFRISRTFLTSACPRASGACSAFSLYSRVSCPPSASIDRSSHLLLNEDLSVLLVVDSSKLDVAGQIRSPATNASLGHNDVLLQPCDDRLYPNHLWQVVLESLAVIWALAAVEAHGVILRQAAGVHDMSDSVAGQCGCLVAEIPRPVFLDSRRLDWQMMLNK